MRRLIPGVGGWDLATLLVAYLLTVLQVVLVGTQISHYQIPGSSLYFTLWQYSVYPTKPFFSI